MKRTPIKRHTPLKKRRSKPRRGQQSALEIAEVRLARYRHAEGRCELRKGDGCIKGVLPFDGPDVWSHGHLAHVRGRGAGGRFTFENTRWSCWWCHLVAVHTKGMKIDEQP